MSLFRRGEPLHVRLAREGGLSLGEESEPEPVAPPPWDATGIHGIQRARAWDVVTTVSAPELTGERVEFAVLAPGRLVVLGEGEVGPLAAAVERGLAPPFRAEAVRRDGDLWAVGARRIEAIELPDTPGEEIELVTSDGERTLLVDGEPSFGSIPALEREGEIVRAHRLSGEIWEVESHPL